MYQKCHDCWHVVDIVIDIVCVRSCCLMLFDSSIAHVRHDPHDMCLTRLFVVLFAHHLYTWGLGTLRIYGMDPMPSMECVESIDFVNSMDAMAPVGSMTARLVVQHLNTLCDAAICVPYSQVFLWLQRNCTRVYVCSACSMCCVVRCVVVNTYVVLACVHDSHTNNCGLLSCYDSHTCLLYLFRVFNSSHCLSMCPLFVCFLGLIRRVAFELSQFIFNLYVIHHQFLSFDSVPCVPHFRFIYVQHKS